MNAKDYQKLVAVVGNIQNNPANIHKANYDQKIEDNEIIEPYLIISMSDYRTLCKMSNVYDSLSKRIVNGRLLPREN